MTQKSLLHAVAAQIANGYETAEVPMYSEHLRMPDRKVIIKIIENLQKVFFPAYFAGGTVSHVSAETFAEFLLGEIYTDLREQVHLAFSNTIADESELRERTNAVCDRFLCRLPQIQTIVPDGADDQENRHAAEQIRTALIIFFLGIEKFIADNRRDEQKPHKIRNNKIFTERNLVVDWHRYKMKIRSYCLFQPHKPWHVENDVE